MSEGWRGTNQSRDPAGLDDDGVLGDAALAEQLGVAEGQQVDDGDGVLLLAAQVGGTLLSGDEGPQLVQVEDGLPEVAATWLVWLGFAVVRPDRCALAE